MAEVNKIMATWKKDMLFHSTNPSGELLMDAPVSVGGNNKGLSPKALMLSALAGCTGIDVISLLEKMRLEIKDLKINVEAELTDEHPRYYNKVEVYYHFYGENLDETKLKKIVDLSVEKYCGVMEMFRHFAEIEISIHFNE
ncbi:MAG: OsmC family protein [Bacteroidales bacterium]